MSKYLPTEWVDDNPPPLNEDNLNKAEAGTRVLHEDIEAVVVGTQSVAKAESCDLATYTKPSSETVIGAIKAWVITDSSTQEKFGFLTAPAVDDLPQPVISMNATKNLPGVIRITFKKSSKAIYFDLYRDSKLVASNISEVYDYYTPEGTWTSISWQ